MDGLLIEGYAYDKVRFSVSAPLMGGAKVKNGRVSSLDLRDHGLAGGEIQLDMGPENQGPDHPVFSYAAKCFPRISKGGRFGGKLVLRRLSDRYGVLSEKTLKLDSLDDAHLLDRLVTEVIHWHADACGPGPFAPRPPAPRRRRP